MLKNPQRYHLPALRCFMGDWVYYTTAMRLSEVAALVKEIEEIHKSQKLCEWIQRQLMRDHADAIARYLLKEPSRFFSAIVVGIFGGSPKWGPLSISDPRDTLEPDEEDRVNRTVGILTISSTADLFPVDGQHRVAGIKAAINSSDPLAKERGNEEVTVIIVGHEKSDEGRTRTRRLFVTLNQTARKVSARDLVALDEDNGIAIVTRNMIDEFDLFKEGEKISFGGGVNILEKDTDCICSVVGLFEIVKALYPRTSPKWPKAAIVQRTRPDTNVLDEMYEYNCDYWNLLCKKVPEYKETLITNKQEPASHRTETRNHLLFRPKGQVAFARAVECLVSRGSELKKVVPRLLDGAKFSLTSRDWHSILWDPIKKKMLSDVTAAETLLLRWIDEEPRTQKASDRLNQIIKDRDKAKKK